MNKLTMKSKITAKQRRIIRAKRTRVKIHGTKLRPRLLLTKSHYRLYGQVVDDDAGKTILSIKTDGKNIKQARDLGIQISNKILSKKIKAVVFDRGGYRYHGVVKTFVESVREGGVQV